MINAAKENIVPLPEYDVFKDAAFVNGSSDRNIYARRDSKQEIPPAQVSQLTLTLITTVCFNCGPF
jgi:hypothetical protein